LMSGGRMIHVMIAKPERLQQDPVLTAGLYLLFVYLLLLQS